ncbi:sensor histidine kinase [Streptococcus marmotae]|uniref:sensor histidine kinase n=1 Tax=Streptococcus marmotae TaxID=1825069 RepID=UPI00083543D6|nr:GHKL domain-containing protein [Streptococcus marmotae]
MKIIPYFIEAILSNGLVIVLFFAINRIRFSSRSIFIALALRVLIAVILATVKQVMPNNLLYYLDLPLYCLLLSFVFLKPLPKTLLIFYGLFPLTLWNLFHRINSYFILSLLEQGKISSLNDSLYYFSALLSLVFVFLFLKWSQYDFIKLQTSLIDLKDQRVLYRTNWAMVIYYVLMQFLTYLEYDEGIMTIDYRRLILVVYLIIFMGLIKQLDRHVREKLQKKLQLQQTLQLSNMENYSHHVEELYREVRGFRHDYANLLTTLRLSIEDDNISQIKEIYETVLKDSHKRLRNPKYDIGRLMNIPNSALKSLLAAKFMQASENNISVTLEVPEVFEPRGMELVDFITIASILLDNAIDAAIGTTVPKINIALLQVDDKQMLIIENSMKEEVIDTSEIYSFGTSSKGSNRGVGLYNVMKILEHYPLTSLNTTSQDYTFCQILEIGLE